MRLPGRLGRFALVVALWAGCSGGPAIPTFANPQVDVRLNEVDCEADTVELINVGVEAADLAHFAVTDDPANPAHRASGRGRLGPSELAVIKLAGFGLRCGEEMVSLLGHGRLVDWVKAMRPMPDGSLGRVPDGVGPFVATMRTPGVSNRAYPDA